MERRNWNHQNKAQYNKEFLFLAIHPLPLWPKIKTKNQIFFMKNIALILMLISYPGLFASLAVASKIKRGVEEPRLKRYWLVVQIMNIFFIFSYAGYIFLLATGGGISGDPRVSTLISAMFFVGGCWVAFLTKVVGLSSKERVVKNIMIERKVQLEKLNLELEKEIIARTEQLNSKAEETRRMIEIMANRDEKLSELRGELEKLKQGHG
jgi:hypothetical protein